MSNWFGKNNNRFIEKNKRWNNRLFDLNWGPNNIDDDNSDKDDEYINVNDITPTIRKNRYVDWADSDIEDNIAKSKQYNQWLRSEIVD